MIEKELEEQQRQAEAAREEEREKEKAEDEEFFEQAAKEEDWPENHGAIETEKGWEV